jgi:hypothetical protein
MRDAFGEVAEVDAFGPVGVSTEDAFGPIAQPTEDAFGPLVEQPYGSEKARELRRQYVATGDPVAKQRAEMALAGEDLAVRAMTERSGDLARQGIAEAGIETSRAFAHGIPIYGTLLDKVEEKMGYTGPETPLSTAQRLGLAGTELLAAIPAFMGTAGATGIGKVAEGASRLQKVVGAMKNVASTTAIVEGLNEATRVALGDESVGGAIGQTAKAAALSVPFGFFANAKGLAGKTAGNIGAQIIIDAMTPEVRQSLRERGATETAIEAIPRYAAALGFALHGAHGDKLQTEAFKKDYAAAVAEVQDRVLKGAPRLSSGETAMPPVLGKPPVFAPAPEPAAVPSGELPVGPAVEPAFGTPAAKPAPEPAAEKLKAFDTPVDPNVRRTPSVQQPDLPVGAPVEGRAAPVKVVEVDGHRMTFDGTDKVVYEPAERLPGDPEKIVLDLNKPEEATQVEALMKRKAKADLFAPAERNAEITRQRSMRMSALNEAVNPALSDFRAKYRSKKIFVDPNDPLAKDIIEVFGGKRTTTDKSGIKFSRLQEAAKEMGLIDENQTDVGDVAALFDGKNTQMKDIIALENKRMDDLMAREAAKEPVSDAAETAAVNEPVEGVPFSISRNNAAKPMTKEEALPRVYALAKLAGIKNFDVVYQPNWTKNGKVIEGQMVNGRMKLNSAALAGQSDAYIKGIIAHEVGHAKFTSKEGQKALDEFVLKHVTPKDVAKVVQDGYEREPGQSEADHRRVVAEELIVRQAEQETPAWTELVDHMAGWAKKAFGLKLTQGQAARAILSSLKGSGEAQGSSFRMGRVLLDPRKQALLEARRRQLLRQGEALDEHVVTQLGGNNVSYEEFARGIGADERTHAMISGEAQRAYAEAAAGSDTAAAESLRRVASARGDMDIQDVANILAYQSELARQSMDNSNPNQAEAKRKYDAILTETGKIGNFFGQGLWAFRNMRGVDPVYVTKALVDQLRSKGAKISPDAERKLAGLTAKVMTIQAKADALYEASIVAMDKRLAASAERVARAQAELKSELDKGNVRYALADAMTAAEQKAFDGFMVEEARLQDARKEQVKGFQDVQPQKFTNMLRGALSGNLFGFMTHQVQVVSNTIRGVDEQFQNLIAAGADSILSKAYKRPRRVVFGASGFKPGLAAGAERVVDTWKSGRPPSKDEQGLFQPRAYHPKDALRDVIEGIVKAGQGEKVINPATGEAMTVSEWGKKVMEATMWYQEGNFRALEMTDAPMRSIVRMMALHEIAKVRGYTGNRMEAFILRPDEAAEKIASKRAANAVFQGRDPIGDTIAGMRHWFQNSPTGVNAVDTLLDTFDAVALHPIIPFVRIGPQILKLAVETAVPMYNAGEAFGRAAKANSLTKELAASKARGDNFEKQRDIETNRNEQHRLALAAGARVVTSTAVAMLGTALGQAGIITGRAPKDPDEAALWYQTHRPNSINFSALNRWRSGGSSEPQPGDRWVSYLVLGHIGVGLASWAPDSSAALTPPEQKSGLRRAADVIFPTEGVISRTLEVMAVRTASQLLDAMGSGEEDKWDAFKRSYAETLPHFQPFVGANLASQASRALQESLPDITKEGGFTPALIRSFNDSWRVMDWYKAYPVRVDPLGDPVKRTPHGVPEFYAYFGIGEKAAKVLYGTTNMFKNVDVPPTDLVWGTLGEVFKATQSPAVLPNPPPKTYQKNNQKIELEPFAYERLAIGVGRIRKEQLTRLFKSAGWKSLTMERRADMIERTIRRADTRAKRTWEIEEIRRGGSTGIAIARARRAR